MKSFYVGCVLISFCSLAVCKKSSPDVIQGNVKEHGWDGPISVDIKTGLLIPPPGLYVAPTENLTLWGPHATLYCKTLDSGSIFHQRYYKDLCHKVENGKKIDLCCGGYTCTRYGLAGGYMCDKLVKIPRCDDCKPPLCKPHKLCTN